MLAIKLKRIGKKHQPSYRLVVQEKREKLGGRYAEDLGWYNPLLKKHEFNKERITYWLKIGAQPTDTVHNLLVKEGVISGPKIAVHKKPRRAEDSKKEEVGAPTEASEAKKKEGQPTSTETPAAAPQAAEAPAEPGVAK